MRIKKGKEAAKKPWIEEVDIEWVVPPLDRRIDR